MNSQISIAEIFKSSWHLVITNKLALFKYFGTVILFQIVASLILAVIFMVQGSETNLMPVVVIYMLVMIVLLMNLQIGLIRAMLGIVDGQKIPVKELFKNFKKILPYLAVMIVSGLIILAGFILLIIPGIYLMIRLYFVYLAVLDPKANIKWKDAISYSWKLTRKRIIIFLKLLFAIFGLAIVVYIPIYGFGLALEGFEYLRLPTVVILMFSVVSIAVNFIANVFLTFFAGFAWIIFYRKLQNSLQNPPLQNQVAPQQLEQQSDLKVIPSNPQQQ